MRYMHPSFAEMCSDFESLHQSDPENEPTVSIWWVVVLVCIAIGAITFALTS